MANLINLEIACEQILGITSRQYRTHVKENGAPPIESGKVDILLACKWLINYYRNSAHGRGNTTALTQERIRNAKASADKKEMENKIMRDEYIHAPTFIQLWSRYVMVASQKLFALPTRAAAALEGVTDIRERREVLIKQVNEVAHELERPDIKAVIRMANSRHTGKGVQNSDEADGKRVGRY